MRQTAAAEIEPAREPVHGAEIDERTAPRRLAEDEDAERLLAENRLDRAARDPVELRIAEVRLPGHPAPDRLDRAVGRLSCASARCTARSCTAPLPAAVIASTAAPTAMPSATISVRVEFARSRRSA